MALSDTQRKKINIGAQLHPPVHNGQKYFGKFTSCINFGAHKLVRSKPFLDSRCEIWQLVLSLYSKVRKFFLYRCTCAHMHIPCSKVLRWICFEISQISIRSGAHKLFRRFLNFSQFVDRNFPKIVALHSNKNEKYLAHLKGQSFLKNMLKIASNDPINNDTKPATCSKYTPSNEPSFRPRSVTKTNIQTPYFRTQIRRALYDLLQTLQGGRARRAHLKGANHFFDPIHSFSASGRNVDFRPVSKFNTAGSLRFAQSCK